MADRKLTYTVGIKDDASSAADRIAANAKKNFKTVSDAIDDSKSDAGRFADALRAMANVAENELRGTEQAVEKLSRALGPELAQDAEQGIRQVVAQLRAAGVEFDDIEANADDLADSFRHMNEVAEKAGGGVAAGFKKVGDAADDTAHRADNSRSVFANFTGNAAQELPGVAGAFGPLNMAVSQFVEYATEGDIALKGLVATAGPIVGIAAIIAGIVGQQRKAAEAAKVEADAVEAITKQLEDGKGAADAMADSLREAGEILVGFSDSGAVDITPALAQAGLTVDQFTQLALSGKDGIEAWGQSMRDAGVDADTVFFVMAGAAQQAEALGSAQDAAAVNARVFGGAEQHAASSMGEVTQASRDQIDALNDQRDAINGTLDATLGLSNAMLDSADALDSYNETMGDAEASDRDKARAGNDLIAAFEREASAARDNAANQATAAGRAATAQQEGVAAQIATLQRLAGNLAPGSPVRSQLEGYIGDLQRTAGTYTSTIAVNAGDAIRQIQAVQRALAGVDANSYEVDVHVRTPGAKASGGSVQAGATYVVGEQGPELLTMGASNGYVTPNGAVNWNPSTGQATINLNVTMNVAASDPRSLMDAFLNMLRRNGNYEIKRALGL